MLARDIMTRNVVSVSPDATVDQAIRLMLDSHVSGLPVVDRAGTTVGIITEGDLLRRSEIGTERKRAGWLTFLTSPGRLAEEYARARGRHVSEVMTREPCTAGEDTPVTEIVDVMTKRGIKRVPVLRGNAIVGIVTRADILHGLSRFLKPDAVDEPHDDAEILASIQSAFVQSNCVPTGLIDVSVKDGAVQLRGAVLDERERTAIRVAVENVPGVREIHDHLSWIEPIGGIVLPSPEDRATEKAGSGTA